MCDLDGVSVVEHPESTHIKLVGLSEHVRLSTDFHHFTVGGISDTVGAALHFTKRAERLLREERD